jgi:hypothetical protein
MRNIQAKIYCFRYLDSEISYIDVITIFFPFACFTPKTLW